MRFTLTIVVSAAAVAMASAVSVGVYSTKTGGGKGGAGHAKGGKGGSGHKQHPQDDRFHLQSDDGQYVFGHTSGTEGRAEIRDKDGTVTGYYSYVNGDGRVAFVNYVADALGYRVLSNTGVPSASVTIVGDGGDRKDQKDGHKDFATVFADFTKRIKDKVVEQAGQKVVEPPTRGDGQYPVDPIVFPTGETKPPKHGGSDQFPDWNQAKNAAGPKTDGGIKRDDNEDREGQRLQPAVGEPNLDGGNDARIITQKPDIKGSDDDGQGSDNKDWSAIITTEAASKQYDVPTVPSSQPQETITETVNLTRTGTDPTVIEDTKIDIAPVTKPVMIDDVQATTAYYGGDDEPVKTTESAIVRGDFQTTVAPRGIKGFEEYSTSRPIPAISDSSTEIKYIEVPTKGGSKIAIVEQVPTGAEAVPTTGGPLRDNNGPSENVLTDDYQTTFIPPGVKGFEEYSTSRPAYPESSTELRQLDVSVKDDRKITIAEQVPTGTEAVPTTGGPLRDNNGQSDNVLINDYQTIASGGVDRWSDRGVVPTTYRTVVDEIAVTVSKAYDEPRATTFQPSGIRIGGGDDVQETSTIIVGVTTKDEDRPEYRTLEPNERIGTTVNPGQFNVPQQEEEIVWPEIPQEPVPQVLVPLDPYAEGARPNKNAGIKTDFQSINTRQARHYDSVDGKSLAVNATTKTTTTAASTTVESTAPPSDDVRGEENVTEFFYPKYFIIG